MIDLTDPNLIHVTDAIAIRRDELTETFVRASGPGGQNVNKVSTAVSLRFDVANSASLTGPVRERLVRLAGSRITRDGVLVITAQRFRSQARNREDAVARLVSLIAEAAIPRTRRRATRPTLGSIERAHQAKRRRATIKDKRRSPPADD